MKDLHNQENNADTTTPVYLPPEMWDGKRITASFKCNEKLWKAWLTHTKRNYGSVCRPMEIMICTALGIGNLKVYQGPTINIENQHISRDIRSRRKAESIDAVNPEHFEVAEKVAQWVLLYYQDKSWPSRSEVMSRLIEGGVDSGLDRIALNKWIIQRVGTLRKALGASS